MRLLLACAFPLIVVAALIKLLPVRLRDELDVLDRQRDDATRDRDVVTVSDHFSGAIPYVLTTAALAALLGFAQGGLFATVPDEGVVFSHRGTDITAAVFLPSLFVAIVAAFPILFRVMQWYYGPQLVDHLDRRGRGNVPMTLREEMKFFPALAWTVAVAATVMNLAFVDTFLSITPQEVRYSTFLSVATHERPIGEVEELVVYSSRRAPNGTVNRRRSLDIRFRDGTVFDTFYVIEGEHIPSVIAALSGSPAFKGTIVESDRVKR